MLISYLHKIDPVTHPSPTCPLCKSHDHDTNHLFSCTALPTQLEPINLWDDPVAVAELLQRWGDALGAAEGGLGR